MATSTSPRRDIAESSSGNTPLRFPISSYAATLTLQLLNSGLTSQTIAKERISLLQETRSALLNSDDSVIRQLLS